MVPWVTGCGGLVVQMLMVACLVRAVVLSMGHIRMEMQITPVAGLWGCLGVAKMGGLDMGSGTLGLIQMPSAGWDMLCGILVALVVHPLAV